MRQKMNIKQTFIAGIRTENVWVCGENPIPHSEYEYGPDCLTEEQMLYVWAKNASRLDLPEDVGFYLKGGSHIVLSLHYKGASSLPKSVTPGVNVIVTSKRPAKRAGTFMMVNSFDSIEPHTTGRQSQFYNKFSDSKRLKNKYQEQI